jgi:diacylglycerol kinase (CTP)
MKSLMDNLGKVTLPQRFKKRSDVHWARKLYHMLGVSFMTLIYANVSDTMAVILLGIAWICFVPADFYRQKNAAFNDFVLHLFKPFMRDHEVNQIAGMSYLLTGVTIIAFVFPRDIVILTMMFLAFADPIASYFGIRYGKDKLFGHKSLQGFLAALVVCTVLSFAFFKFYGPAQERILMISLIGGLIGALSELIPIGKLDDNFTLPVLSASALWLVFYALV